LLPDYESSRIAQHVVPVRVSDFISLSSRHGGRFTAETKQRRFREATHNRASFYTS